MKNKKTVYCFLALAMCILGLVSACNNFNKPAMIYDPNKNYPGNPAIADVLPPGGAIAGVREITIKGENFITNLDSIHVYFDSEVALIKTASDSQLVAYRPLLYGDSVLVKVVIPSRLGIAKSFNYYIEQPIEQWGNFSTIARAFYAMEFDDQDRLWISSRRYIYTLTADGLYVTVFKNDKMGLSSTFDELTDMRFGVEGYLYFVLGDTKNIYRINPQVRDSLPPQVYCTLPANVAKMDFTNNGSVYTAGRNTGIYLVDASKNITATGHYTSTFTPVDLRVFGNYVYIANSTSVYKNAIQGDGSLGTDELLVDITTVPEVATCKILSFSIDINGKIYLCLENHPQYSVFYLENDGSITPYYINNILPRGVEQLIWGNSRYLFLNRGKGELTNSLRGVYKMGMMNDGAPYLGRDLQ